MSAKCMGISGYGFLGTPRVDLMEVLLTYKKSNIVVKIEEGDDSLSIICQALLIAVDSHSGGTHDHSAAERCNFSDGWFLSFTTGSLVCVTQPIHIVFNNLMGLARRAIL